MTTPSLSDLRRIGALAILARAEIIDFGGHFGAHLSGPGAGTGDGMFIGDGGSVRGGIKDADFVSIGLCGRPQAPAAALKVGL